MFPKCSLSLLLLLLSFYYKAHLKESRGKGKGDGENEKNLDHSGNHLQTYPRKLERVTFSHPFP